MARPTAQDLDAAFATPVTQDWRSEVQKATRRRLAREGLAAAIDCFVISLCRLGRGEFIAAEYSLVVARQSAELAESNARKAGLL